MKKLSLALLVILTLAMPVMAVNPSGHIDARKRFVPDPESFSAASVSQSIRTSTATLTDFAVENARELIVKRSVCAFLRTALTGSNNDLDYVAKAGGSGGLAITIAYVDPSANNAALSVTVSSNAITVHLATGVAGAITSTAAQIKAAIDAYPAAAALVSAANAPANDGSGVVIALSPTNLGDASGTNPTFDVKLQTSADGTNYYDVPNASFTQATAVATETKVFVGLGLRCRWVITVGGTSTPTAAIGLAATTRIR
jgi:hypothetical protein